MPISEFAQARLGGLRSRGAAALALAIAVLLGMTMLSGCSATTPDGSSGSAQTGSSAVDAAPGATDTANAATNAVLANNAVLAGGAAASNGTWDFFYSSEQSAICRASVDSPQAEAIVSVPESEDYAGYPAYLISHLAVDGDALYYIAAPIDNSAGISEVHRVSIDGSDDQLIYTYEPEVDEQGSGTGFITQLSAFDGTVYITASAFESDSSNASDAGDSYTSVSRVIVLDEDGTVVSDDQLSLGASGTVIATPDLSIALKAETEGDATSGGVAAVEPGDEGEQTEIYHVDNGFVLLAALTDTSVVFQELIPDGGSSICQMALDGSDMETLYAEPDGMTARLIAVSEDTAFVQLYDADAVEVTEWDLLALPLDGGEAETIAEGLDYANPTVSVLGNHLLITENGEGIGSDGARVAAYSFDGELLAEYEMSE